LKDAFPQSAIQGQKSKIGKAVKHDSNGIAQGEKAEPGQCF
jgi:hypothetical protein